MAGKDITLYEESTSTNLFPRTYTRNVFDEDGTTTLKTLLANIVNEAGKIAEVKVNGTALTITNKSVNIDLSGYQSKGKIDITDTTPTSVTKYYPIYSTNSGTNQIARANADLYYYDSGTWSSLNVGTKDHKGILTLHWGNSSTDYYVDIAPGSALTGNRTLTIPDASGTIALTSQIPSTSSFFAKAGGDITGHVYLTGSSASSSTGNTSQLVFGKSSAQHVVLSSNAQALVINPTTSSTTNQIVLYLNSQSQFPSGIKSGGIVSIGNANMSYDSTNKCLKFTFS